MNASKIFPHNYLIVITLIRPQIEVFMEFRETSLQENCNDPPERDLPILILLHKPIKMSIIFIYDCRIRSISPQYTWGYWCERKVTCYEVHIVHTMEPHNSWCRIEDFANKTSKRPLKLLWIETFLKHKSV